MLTVIIATLNRSKSINEISLPSLLKQDTTDFEVLIWDASEDDLTEKAVESYQSAFAERGVALRYVRAPRRGSASQRNDAVKEANGDIVFFIDDDSEVSPSGVSSVAAAFEKNEKLYGAALPLATVLAKNQTSSFGLSRGIITAAKKIFWKESNYRQIKRSTINILPKTDAPSAAEWLSGGDMAYRKSVFDELRFDERLERFGGYALGEDMDLSHRVMLHYGEPLQILPGGSVTHHQAEGGRLDSVKMSAAYFYNFRIIRDNFIKYDNRKFEVLSFLWERRILFTLNLYRNGYNFFDIMEGYKAYRKAREELKPANHSKPSALLK